jgi:hypothetical protein
MKSAVLFFLHRLLISPMMHAGDLDSEGEKLYRVRALSLTPEFTAQTCLSGSISNIESLNTKFVQDLGSRYQDLRSDGDAGASGKAKANERFQDVRDPFYFSAPPFTAPRRHARMSSVFPVYTAARERLRCARACMICDLPALFGACKARPCSRDAGCPGKAKY